MALTRKEISRRYYERHAQEIREMMRKKSKIRRETQPERVKEVRNRSYHKNKERHRGERTEYQRSYYERTKDRRKRLFAERYIKDGPAMNTKKRSTYAESREVQLKRKFGLSQADHDALLEAQGGVCAICGGPPRGRGEKLGRFSVDHCHLTGRVRGLLCQRCNSAIGLLNDDAELVRRAVAYLEKGETTNNKL